MKKPPLLIIITGHPGTGKTTLARRLSDDFNLPYIWKDGIKETLFDSLGWSDREWSKKMGVATYPLLYYFMEVLLKAGTSFIVEANFDPKYSTAEILRLKDKYPFEPFQIQCYTKGEVLVERYRQRAGDNSRHPGHTDLQALEELKERLLNGHLAPMELGGIIYPYDTTDFEKVDYPALREAVKEKREE